MICITSRCRLKCSTEVAVPEDIDPKEQTVPEIDGKAQATNDEPCVLSRGESACQGQGGRVWVPNSGNLTPAPAVGHEFRQNRQASMQTKGSSTQIQGIPRRRPPSRSAG